MGEREKRLEKLPCEVFMEMARQEVNQRRLLESVLKEQIATTEAENNALHARIRLLEDKLLKSQLLCQQYRNNVTEAPAYLQIVSELRKAEARCKRLQNSLNDLVFKYNQLSGGSN